MVKPVLKVCFWVLVFLLCGAQVRSEDIEDRFINPYLSTSKTIFIDVKDVSLVNVLKIISQQSGLSFIASQDVADKKITLYLNKIPLNQALQMVLDANGLTYEMQNDSNVFVIKNKETTAKNLITKVYQLKYATVSVARLAGGGSSSGGSSSGSSSSGGTPSGASSSGSSSSGTGTPGSTPGSSSSQEGSWAWSGGCSQRCYFSGWQGD